MRRCTLEEVARLSGGRRIKGDPSLPVERLHTDTRTLAAGDCFVALRGDRFDGHEFVGEVRERGAVAALVSNRLTREVPEDLGLVEVAVLLCRQAKAQFHIIIFQIILLRMVPGVEFMMLTVIRYPF